MYADLPVCFVRFAAVLIQLLLRHHLDAEIIGAADIGLRKPGGAFGDRTIGNHFHSADADPLVAEAGANAGGKHPIDFSIMNQAVDARRKFTGLMGILVAAEIIVHPPSVVRGSDAGARHHLGDELYGFAVVIAAVSVANSFVENLRRSLADPPVELSGFWIAVEAPTRRVRRTFADAGSAVSERVDVSSVSAAM